MTEVSAAVLAAAAFPAHTAPLAGGVALPPGSIVFANASGALAQDNANYSWDSVNLRVHAAHGVLSDNGFGPLAKDTGGTVRSMIALGGDNVLRIGANAALPSNGHTFIYGGANLGLTIGPTGDVSTAHNFTTNKLAIGGAGINHIVEVLNASSAARTIDVTHNIPNGTPTGNLQGIFYQTNITSTDGSVGGGIYAQTNYGAQGASPISSIGSAGAFESFVNIYNVGNSFTEFSNYVAFQSHYTNDPTTVGAATPYQRVNVAAATGGTFNIGWGANNVDVAYNVSPGALQTALAALASVGAGNVTVDGVVGDYYVTVYNALAGAPQAWAVNGASLTGAGAAVTQYGGFGNTNLAAHNHWLGDWNYQGPINARPNAMVGLSLFGNNHYNGDPVLGPGAMLAITTGKKNGGGGSTPLFYADTFPMGRGLVIGGVSSSNGVVGQGFGKAIQIGGDVVDWNVHTSRVGTGIDIQDFDTAGINFGAAYGASATAPSIVFGASSNGFGSDVKFAVDSTYNVGTTAKRAANIFATNYNMKNAGVFISTDSIGGNVTMLTLASDNTMRIGTINAPTTNGHLLFFVAGVEVGRFAPAGALQVSNGIIFATDNAKDIGASGTNRPRDFFLARNNIVGGHLLSTQTTGTVAAAAGANAGTTPPAPVLTACTDTKGSVTFGTGTTPALGAQVAVTFGTAYAATPVVHVQEQNSATKALGAYISAVSTTGFTVSTTGAPAASQANTVYSIGYAVIG